MSRRGKICNFADNVVSKMGWSEEDWHWYWFCMYQSAVNSFSPAMANIILHYNEIPTELIIKFTENYETDTN